MVDTCVDSSTAELRVLGVTARVNGPDDILSALQQVAPITPSWVNAALPPASIEFDVEIDEFT